MADTQKTDLQIALQELTEMEEWEERKDKLDLELGLVPGIIERVTDEWRRILYEGSIYETTSELRDALSLLDTWVRRMKEDDAT